MKSYTDKAKKALNNANRLSRSMGCNYVGTEHILAGLMKEGTGVAAEVLAAAGVEISKLLEMIEQLISPGESVAVEERDGYTPRAQATLERAADEAEHFGCEEVGTEHLLIAMVKEGDCAASRLLNTMGVNSQKLLVELLAAMGEDPSRYR